MAKTENLLQAIARIEARTGIPRTIFAACPNSTAVVRAAFRAAKRNNAPIYFAATLNQIDCDGGYTGLTPGPRPSPLTTAARGSRTSRASNAGRPRRRWPA